jgi:hypothetical protein
MRLIKKILCWFLGHDEYKSGHCYVAILTCARCGSVRWDR